jgi:hypothetical protein
MKAGVVYKFNPRHKLNGTLFYSFEYFKFLQKYIDVNYYVIGLSPQDLNLVTNVFQEKYITTPDITPVKTTELYGLKLDRTLVLDIDSFYYTKECLTNEVHCYSNNTHPMFRYKNPRQVTYYGCYHYQNFDVTAHARLNFEIFKPITKSQPGVFISGREVDIKSHLSVLEKQFNKPVILKKAQSGTGNLFELIDHVHYMHFTRDTNNRIIPEAFFYNKKLTIDSSGYDGIDSVSLRYNDILQNGLGNYTLSESDEMIQAMLR